MTARPRLDRWIWLLVALAAAIPYLDGLRGDFTFDDEGLILKNPAVEPAASFLRPWTSPYWPERHAAGLYRPFTGWTFWLQRRLSGDDPFAFHALNVLLHLSVCLVVLSVLRRLVPGDATIALFATLLFAVHPVHTEAVTGIVGRAELLAALCALAAYRLWLRPSPRRAPLIALLFALGLAAKESAIGWIAIAGLHRAGFFNDGRAYKPAPPSARRDMLTADGALALGLFAYLAARYAVLGAAIGAGATPIENPLVNLPPLLRLVNACKVLAIGLARVLWPSALLADYSHRTIALAPNVVSDAGFWTLFFVALALVTLVIRRRAPLLTWSLALYAAIVFPVSNLAVLIGTILGERLLYLPSLGILTAVAALLVQAFRRFAPRSGRSRVAVAGPVLIAALVLALAVRTWERNPVWRGNLELFSATVSAAPNNVKARVNLATSLFLAGRPADAETHYRRALKVQPDYLPALNSLGHLRVLERRYPEAESLLVRATALYPQNTESFVRLGNLYLEIRRPEDALAAFDRSLTIDRASADGWIGHASALFMLERFPESAESWERAVSAARGKPDLRLHLAAAYERAGRYSDASAIVEALVVERAPDPDLLATLASLRLAQGDAGTETMNLVAAALNGEIGRHRLEELTELLIRRKRCDQAKAVISSKAASLLQPAERDSLRAFIVSGCAET